ncbi:MAG: DUF370 domain-containing protein [Clostridia bacterium]|nr:DUF370 domain-containing protein [Clostridia bacterium]MBQ8759741.1 DUF370 domain-containing protein [Clostridia bacterium]
MKLVNIGYGNMVNTSRIVSVVSPDAAPIKRLIQDTRSTGKLVDATGGKKTRSVIVSDSGHIILSALTSETIQSRIAGSADNAEDEDDE